MIYDIKASCGCFVGTARDNNEDNFLFSGKHLDKENMGIKTPIEYEGKSDENIIFSVFDGLGGHACGEEASLCAAKTFLREEEQLRTVVMSGKEFYAKAVYSANEEICLSSRKNGMKGMGSTVASVKFFQDEVYACNVGDSKIFRMRDFQMVQISEDHTDEKILRSIGSTKKPSLMQYLGIPAEEMTIEPFVTKGELRKGDIYIVCSDGVTGVLASEEIYEFAKSSESLSEAVKNILNEIKIRNGEDNATVIIAKVQ